MLDEYQATKTIAQDGEAAKVTYKFYEQGSIPSDYKELYGQGMKNLICYKYCASYPYMDSYGGVTNLYYAGVEDTLVIGLNNNNDLIVRYIANSLTFETALGQEVNERFTLDDLMIGKVYDYIKMFLFGYETENGVHANGVLETEAPLAVNYFLMPNIEPDCLSLANYGSLYPWLHGEDDLCFELEIPCSKDEYNTFIGELDAKDSFVKTTRVDNYGRKEVGVNIYTIEDKKYQKAYFFEDYKKQYGKTYEEDFETIKAQGLRRVGLIKSLAASSRELLDIGCAYGPFLSAAADYGMNSFGTDIAEDAVSYVQNKLKLPAVCSVFPEINTAEEFGIAQFDVVTMWYVIEHFKDLGSVLRKVSSLVKKGGIFAFSTPSGEGVSAVSDKDHFYQISPTDHYTIWEPSRADSILRQFGFKVERIISTGHHPERFPSIKKSGAKPGSLKWMLVEAQSHAKRLGDTVEIYCRKI